MPGPLLLLVVGITGLVAGLLFGVPAAALDGVSASSAGWTLAGLLGLAATAAAVWMLLRGRRRRVQLLALPAAVVGVQWLVVPAVNAGLVTHSSHVAGPAASTLGLPGAQDVTVAGADGVRLSAWYVPGHGHAAVILLHGSHGTRADALGHLRLLHRAGFAVLALDSRGHGDSGGPTNALGWGADRDVRAAAEWLEGRGFAPGRIGALGLSMGAEVALRAAAEGTDLAAVVADGAGASTEGDLRLVPRGALWAIADSVTWLTMRGVELVSGVREPPPLADVLDQVRVPVLLVASNRAGERELGAAYRARIGRRASLWYVPDAGHTRALAAHPLAYAARVLSFLELSLSVR